VAILIATERPDLQEAGTIHRHPPPRRASRRERCGRVGRDDGCSLCSASSCHRCCTSAGDGSSGCAGKNSSRGDNRSNASAGLRRNVFSQGQDHYHDRARCGGHGVLRWLVWEWNVGHVIYTCTGSSSSTGAAASRIGQLKSVLPCPCTMTHHPQLGEPHLSRAVDCQWWLELRPILSAQRSDQDQMNQKYHLI